MRHGPEPHPDGTVTFRVWAPRARRVELLLDGRTLPMAPSDEHPGGGWFALRTHAGIDARYAFRLDGGPARPDPASRHQPDGVHDASALVDLRALPYAVDNWRVAPLEQAVIYELHVGAFTPEGTLAAAVGHLDELADLGVTHVELMPVNGVGGTRNWGYDGVAWYAVHEPYGGPQGLALLIDACHARGLGVILDAVYNHLGPSGNSLPEFGPYLVEGERSTWGERMNLDGPDSDPVRAFIVGSAAQWLRDYRADALRLDAVHALVDTSARHLLAELADTVAALRSELGRDVALIAESDRNDPLTITPRAANGLGMDAQWADDLHHAIHTAVTGERDGYYADFTGLPDVARAYRNGFCFDGRWSPHRRRTVGAPLPDAIPGHRLVTCVQNHDQVGNRAAGERLTVLAPPRLVRLAVLLLCAAPNTPLLWMGEEYGETNPFCYFTSHHEPALARAVTQGRAEEFAGFTSWTSQAVPDPQDPGTFERSKLDWAKSATEEGRARRALWQDLLALRRALPALAERRRDLVAVHQAEQDTLLLRRDAPDAETVLVAANLAEHAAVLALPEGPWRLLLDSEHHRYAGDDGGATVEGTRLTLAPGTGALLAGPPPDARTRT